MTICLCRHLFEFRTDRGNSTAGPRDPMAEYVVQNTVKRRGRPLRPPAHSPHHNLHLPPPPPPHHPPYPPPHHLDHTLVYLSLFLVLGAILGICLTGLTHTQASNLQLLSNTSYSPTIEVTSRRQYLCVSINLFR